MRRRALRAALVVAGGMAALLTGDAVAVVHDQRPAPCDHAPEPDQVRPALLRNQIYDAFDRDDPQAAAELLDQYLERFSDDGLMLYNAACAQARMAKLDEAEIFLRKALAAGFVDCSHFRRDPDMAPLRDRPVLRAILAARDAADGLLADRVIEQWTTTHGDAYRVTRDEQRRINLVTALPPATHDQLMLRVQRQADHLAESIFGMPLRHYVMVVLAAERDAIHIFENPAVSGHYNHRGRQLIVADVNPSMPHELVHAFHNNHMDDLGQDHPIWIREGLATLYETYRFDADLAIDYVTNDRDVLVRSLTERDELVTWRDLFSLDARQFKFRGVERYAQVRTIFEFLAARGMLGRWYAAYTEGYAEDRTGVLALESVFGLSLAEIEARWRTWLDGRSLDETPVVLAMLPSSMTVIGEPASATAPETVREQQSTAVRRGGRSRAVERVYRRGRTSYREGEYRKAIELFTEVVTEVPDDADAHYDLALAYVRVGDLALAQDQLSVLERLDASLASLLGNLVPRHTPSTPPSSERTDEVGSSNALPNVLDSELRVLPPVDAHPRSTCSPLRGCRRQLLID